MTTQPEALRLAKRLGGWGTTADEQFQAAAELRRLHEANEAFGKRQEWWNERMFVLEQQRDALLEALKKIEAIEDKMFGSDWEEIEEARDIARAAIKAAEENT